MIRTIVDVIRGEGFASALRRTAERLSEAPVPSDDAPILNVSPTGLTPRTGGTATQLLWRLRAERAFRPVKLSPRPLPGAKVIHFEGTSGVNVDDVLRMIDAGVKVVISIHDLSALGSEWRSLLARATGVIFPSQFLRDKYGLPFEAEVIEPGVPAGAHRRGRRCPTEIAYAGAVQRHKGAHLLPEIAADKIHVFGGGDVDLLRTLRRSPHLEIHGYYRSGTLQRLLARHDIGLVILPSIVEESFGLALSEAWLAGASVAAFDHGALAERIRRDGGGWLAPVESGAQGISEIVRRWQAGETIQRAPRPIASPVNAARAHIDLYRRWGLLG